MKHLSKVFVWLLLAALPYSALAQETCLLVEYMKVTQETEDAYLEVEQQWKKIHEKRIEDGLINGWQLWRNIYAGYNDPYQYVTITWYDNWAQSLSPEQGSYWQNMDLDLGDDFFEKTAASRVLATKDVSHSTFSAENNKGGKFIRVNQMQPAPGKWDDFLKMENEVMKPLFEESIRKGMRANWGVWETWPYREGQVRLTTVDGFESIEQMATEDLSEVFKQVHPDLEMSELSQKVGQLRDMVAVEIWELVDSAWPASSE